MSHRARGVLVGAAVAVAFNAWVQNLRRGHCGIAGDQPAGDRLRAAFDELMHAI